MLVDKFGGEGNEGSTNLKSQVEEGHYSSGAERKLDPC
jgi:hypothetical protein